jgi:hypothetical protein
MTRYRDMANLVANCEYVSSDALMGYSGPERIAMGPTVTP